MTLRDLIDFTVYIHDHVYVEDDEPTVTPEDAYWLDAQHVEYSGDDQES